MNFRIKHEIDKEMVRSVADPAAVRRIIISEMVRRLANEIIEYKFKGMDFVEDKTSDPYSNDTITINANIISDSEYNDLKFKARKYDELVENRVIPIDERFAKTFPLPHPKF